MHCLTRWMADLHDVRLGSRLFHAWIELGVCNRLSSGVGNQNNCVLTSHHPCMNINSIQACSVNCLKH